MAAIGQGGVWAGPEPGTSIPAFPRFVFHYHLFLNSI
ncbi:hypothetical protein EN933_16170 [Mesorhizobium sp. M7A.F.Ca.US.001.01.1.1]|nr:hypothetical protein EN933_16170 [Mesorhizobium sp. M7A.F.Ca.US.001.01.1.1]